MKKVVCAIALMVIVLSVIPAMASPPTGIDGTFVVVAPMGQTEFAVNQPTRLEPARGESVAIGNDLFVLAPDSRAIPDQSSSANKSATTSLIGTRRVEPVARAGDRLTGAQIVARQDSIVLGETSNMVVRMAIVSQSNSVSNVLASGILTVTTPRFVPFGTGAHAVAQFVKSGASGAVSQIAKGTPVMTPAYGIRVAYAVAQFAT